MPPPILALSAIDTLLTASSPSAFKSAAAGLRRLRGEGVDVVLCSGRTRAELEHTCQELDAALPFVCEYGGAAFVPAGCFDFEVPHARDVAGYQALEFGRPYVEVVAALRHAADTARVPVQGFSDMSVEAVARECGLSLLDARLAKLREYGELFRIVEATPQARRRLARALHGSHLLCTTQGAFEHVGAAVDAGIGAASLRALYRRAHGDLISVAFADSLAGDDLLALVSHPFVVGGAGGVMRDPGPMKAPLVTARDVGEWTDALLEIVMALRLRASVRRDAVMKRESVKSVGSAS